MGITQCLLHVEKAIIIVQALGDRTNPSVLWLKYDLNINKNGIFAIQLYFLNLFFVKNDHGTFFNGRDKVFALIKSTPYRYRNSTTE